MGYPSTSSHDYNVTHSIPVSEPLAPMKMLAVSLKYHLTSSWVNCRALVSLMYTVKGDNSQVTVCQFASFSRMLVIRVCSGVLTLSCPTLVSENSAKSVILSDFPVTHTILCFSFQQLLPIVSLKIAFLTHSLLEIIISYAHINTTLNKPLFDVLVLKTN